MDTKELLERIEKDNVKFISLQFTDVSGTVKSVDMPVRNFPDAAEDGVWFDGSSVAGFARIQESDMRLIVDKEPSDAPIPVAAPVRRWGGASPAPDRPCFAATSLLRCGGTEKSARSV